MGAKMRKSFDLLSMSNSDIRKKNQTTKEKAAISHTHGSDSFCWCWSSHRRTATARERLGEQDRSLKAGIHGAMAGPREVHQTAAPQ
jgi:hypothetical protein